MTRRFSDVRVLDLSRILAGPSATQLLGDLGADVVKIENPAGGDDTRGWGPPFIDNSEGQRAEAAYFACCNRNKRSVALDFSTSEDVETLKKMVTKSRESINTEVGQPLTTTTMSNMDQFPRKLSVSL